MRRLSELCSLHITQRLSFFLQRKSVREEIHQWCDILEEFSWYFCWNKRHRTCLAAGLYSNLLHVRSFGFPLLDVHSNITIDLIPSSWRWQVLKYGVFFPLWDLQTPSPWQRNWASPCKIVFLSNPEDLQIQFWGQTLVDENIYGHYSLDIYDSVTGQPMMHSAGCISRWIFRMSSPSSIARTDLQLVIDDKTLAHILPISVWRPCVVPGVGDIVRVSESACCSRRFRCLTGEAERNRMTVFRTNANS
jgi:hypothetical protein